jgi:hypothetical protein
VDDVTLGPALSVVAVRGSRVVASTDPTVGRPDVVAALQSPNSLMSGFSISVPPGKGPLTLLALNADGTVSPMAGDDSGVSTKLPPSITLSDGEQAPVVIRPGHGHVDTVTSVDARVLKIGVPSGTNLSQFPWMTVTTNGNGTREQFAFGDSVSDISHQITWWSLPQGGARLSVEVGSCLQWHGFGKSPLFLVVHGRGSVRSVTLSR